MLVLYRVSTWYPRKKINVNNLSFREVSAAEMAKKIQVVDSARAMIYNGVKLNSQYNIN